MRVSMAAMALTLIIATMGAVCAEPRVRSGDMPGRERERFFDPLSPPVPHIELRDGRPAPVVETGKKPRPVKRKKCRGARRC